MKPCTAVTEAGHRWLQDQIPVAEFHMQCLLSPLLRLAWLAGLLAPASACLALSPAPIPVLQVSGDDFPSLIVHQPVLEESGLPAALSCAQIRSKRVDELDPLWKRATGRIHLECDDLTLESAGFDLVATMATAYLLPGAVQFAGIPVAEVRLMNSELWSDRQYVLARLNASTGRPLPWQSRCRTRQDTPGLLGVSDCEILAEADGLYLETGDQGGIWLHPDPDNPAMTLYAEVWSD